MTGLSVTGGTLNHKYVTKAKMVLTPLTKLDFELSCTFLEIHVLLGSDAGIQSRTGFQKLSSLLELSDFALESFLGILRLLELILQLVYRKEGLFGFFRDLVDIHILVIVIVIALVIVFAGLDRFAPLPA